MIKKLILIIAVSGLLFATEDKTKKVDLDFQKFLSELKKIQQEVKPKKEKDLNRLIQENNSIFSLKNSISKKNIDLENSIKIKNLIKFTKNYISSLERDIKFLSFYNAQNYFKINGKYYYIVDFDILKNNFLKLKKKEKELLVVRNILNNLEDLKQKKELYLSNSVNMYLSKIETLAKRNTNINSFSQSTLQKKMIVCTENSCSGISIIPKEGGFYIKRLR